MIFIASLLGFERPMWAGIATMSVIQPFCIFCFCGSDRKKPQLLAEAFRGNCR